MIVCRRIECHLQLLEVTPSSSHKARRCAEESIRGASLKVGDMLFVLSGRVGQAEFIHIRDRAFPVAAARAWNSLPSFVTLWLSLSTLSVT